MHNERSPSLFLPKLAAVLFIAVFLSGMAEIVCLARSAQASHYSIANETSKFMSKPDHVSGSKVSNEVDLD
jgi:hypothetical protein